MFLYYQTPSQVLSHHLVLNYFHSDMSILESASSTQSEEIALSMCCLSTTDTTSIDSSTEQLVPVESTTTLLFSSSVSSSLASTSSPRFVKTNLKYSELLTPHSSFSAFEITMEHFTTVHKGIFSSFVSMQNVKSDLHKTIYYSPSPHSTKATSHSTLQTYISDVDLTTVSSNFVSPMKKSGSLNHIALILVVTTMLLVILVALLAASCM